MKRILALALAMALGTFCGCSNSVISSQGSIAPPASSAAPYPAEYPDPNTPLPIDREEVAATQPEKPPTPPTPPTPPEPPKPANEPSQSAAAPPSGSTASPDAPAPSSTAPAPVAPPAVELPSPSAAPQKDPPTAPTADVPNEVSAVWISYLEFLTAAQGKTKAQFTANIEEMFAVSADYGLNTVFVQVRPFGDALYASDIFPWSYVLTGEEGNDPGYDPLAIMVQKAQEHGLRIEAWINPYRVRAKGSPKAICAENPVNAYLKSGSNAVIRYDGGTYYNPASQAARDLITEGVIEIIKNYAVDGIHFDDYFYPTTDAAFDASDYRAYRSSGGSMALADWRRENVNKLVRQVYAAVKQEKSSVLFGISPQARIDTNYNVQYADVGKWLSGSGYVDYICPQIYFGFEHDTAPYSTLLDSWNQMAKGSGVDLYVGLAVYKCGVADGGAGSAKNEWINTDAMLEHQVEEARGKSAYAGFVLYRYDSIFRPASAVQSCIARERANLESIL